MSATYQRHIEGYLADCVRLRRRRRRGRPRRRGVRAASSFAGIFSAKPATARGDAAYKPASAAAVPALAEPPPSRRCCGSSRGVAPLWGDLPLGGDAADGHRVDRARLHGRVLRRDRRLRPHLRQGDLPRDGESRGHPHQLGRDLRLLLVRVNAGQRSRWRSAAAAPRLLLPARPGARVVALQAIMEAHVASLVASRRSQPPRSTRTTSRGDAEPSRACARCAPRRSRRSARSSARSAPRSSGCSRGSSPRSSRPASAGGAW